MNMFYFALAFLVGSVTALLPTNIDQLKEQLPATLANYNFETKDFKCISGYKFKNTPKPKPKAASMNNGINGERYVVKFTAEITEEIVSDRKGMDVEFYVLVEMIEKINAQVKDYSIIFQSFIDCPILQTRQLIKNYFHQLENKRKGTLALTESKSKVADFFKCFQQLRSSAHNVQIVESYEYVEKKSRNLDVFLITFDELLQPYTAGAVIKSGTTSIEMLQYRSVAEGQMSEFRIPVWNRKGISKVLKDELCRTVKMENLVNMMQSFEICGNATTEKLNEDDSSLELYVIKQGENHNQQEAEMTVSSPPYNNNFGVISRCAYNNEKISMIVECFNVSFVEANRKVYDLASESVVWLAIENIGYKKIVELMKKAKGNVLRIIKEKISLKQQSGKAESRLPRQEKEITLKTFGVIQHTAHDDKSLYAFVVETEKNDMQFFGAILLTVNVNQTKAKVEFLSPFYHSQRVLQRMLKPCYLSREMIDTEGIIEWKFGKHWTRLNTKLLDAFEHYAHYFKKSGFDDNVGKPMTQFFDILKQVYGREYAGNWKLAFENIGFGKLGNHEEVEFIIFKVNITPSALSQSILEYVLVSLSCPGVKNQVIPKFHRIVRKTATEVRDEAEIKLYKFNNGENVSL